MSSCTTQLNDSVTQTNVEVLPCPLSVTQKATNKVKSIVAENDFKDRIYLRVRVQGGGCSGFQNKLDLDPNYNEKLDQLFEFDGVGVVVDKRSMLYLDGAVIDFHDDLNKSGFSVTNPTAKSTCGCGSSYSV
ncbi:MAG: iron-sulfur cluster assembly accessory protein [Planctomycetota bacterium]|nr:iron-sulfur cluster assembly accessory protein [Planctomycetota bacterium]